MSWMSHLQRLVAACQHSNPIYVKAHVIAKLFRGASGRTAWVKHQRGDDHADHTEMGRGSDSNDKLNQTPEVTYGVQYSRGSTQTLSRDDGTKKPESSTRAVGQCVQKTCSRPEVSDRAGHVRRGRAATGSFRAET